jgi:L-lysine exporter family protein LysE/ArgO
MRLCCDKVSFLVSLGVAGLGTLVQTNPMLLSIAKYGGAAFLFFYGFFAAKRALRPSGGGLSVNSAHPETIAPTSLKKTMLECLAFTFLNPHCYLDTVVLMGSLSAQFEGTLRWAFAAGAVSASFVWFFSLAYGARLLAPLFERPIAWRALDAIIALVMFAIAVALLRS